MLNNMPDLNDGKPWSEMDIEDLKDAISHGKTLKETMTFLCRSDWKDVAAQAKKLGLTWQRGGTRRKGKSAKAVDRL